jgi:hypothetical protein
MLFNENSDLIKSGAIPAMVAIRAVEAAHELGHCLAFSMVAQRQGKVLNAYKVVKADGHLSPSADITLSRTDRALIALMGPAVGMTFKAELYGASDPAELNWRTEPAINTIAHAIVASGSSGDLAQYLAGGGYAEWQAQPMVLGLMLGEALAKDKEAILRLFQFRSEIEETGEVEIDHARLESLLGISTPFEEAA